MSKSVHQYLADYQKLHAGESDFIINGKRHRSNKLFDGSNFVDKLLEPFETALDSYPERAVRVLDYGCGKANHLFMSTKTKQGQTLPPFLEYIEPHTIQVYWCYDPGFLPFAQKPPKQSFDIVICADVMEHVPEEAVIKTLMEIGSMISGKGHILFTISCKPAVKHFEDGENLHATVQSPEWWQNRIVSSISRKNIHVIFETPEGEVVWNRAA